MLILSFHFAILVLQYIRFSLRKKFLVSAKINTRNRIVQHLFKPGDLTRLIDVYELSGFHFGLLIKIPAVSVQETCFFLLGSR